MIAVDLGRKAILYERYTKIWSAVLPFQGLGVPDI
jgi:hypothetical protein